MYKIHFLEIYHISFRLPVVFPIRGNQESIHIFVHNCICIIHWSMITISKLEDEWYMKLFLILTEWVISILFLVFSPLSAVSHF